MTEGEKVEFLQGQIQALQTCVLALIETHPDPQRFSVFLEEFLQAALAKCSGEAFHESVIEGLQDTMEKLQNYTASAVARQSQRGQN